MELADAQTIADSVLLRLSPYSKRIEVAGSIRRGKADVHDIEMVAIPKTIPTFDIFGEKCGERSLLNDRKLIESIGIVQRAGRRFVQVELFAKAGFNLDLFIVQPPAQWGVLFAIRTGPADFSKWIVTSRSKGGALPNGWRCEDGRIWDGQTTLQFFEEIELLEWLGFGWIEPSKREAKWGNYRRNYRG